jgi:small GTP-binding protein
MEANETFFAISFTVRTRELPGRVTLSKLAPTDVHEEIAKNSHFGLKVVMMGDGAVGKTSLVLRYTQNSFSPEYKQSLGASFAVKDLEVEDQSVKLVIWDVAGQPSFRQVRRHYYSGAHGALLVFDVTNPLTFMTLHNWFADFRRVVPTGAVILVANKVDLTDERQVPSEAAHMLRDLWNVPYIETSAATAEGVQNAFLQLAIYSLQRAKSTNKD